MLDDLSDDMRRKLEALEMDQPNFRQAESIHSRRLREHAERGDAIAAAELAELENDRQAEERAKLWDLYRIALLMGYQAVGFDVENIANHAMALAEGFLARWKAEMEAPVTYGKADCTPAQDDPPDPDAVSDQEMDRQLAKQEREERATKTLAELILGELDLEGEYAPEVILGSIKALCEAERDQPLPEEPPTFTAYGLP